MAWRRWLVMTDDVVAVNCLSPSINRMPDSYQATVSHCQLTTQLDRTVISHQMSVNGQWVMMVACQRRCWTLRPLHAIQLTSGPRSIIEFVTCFAANQGGLGFRLSCCRRAKDEIWIPPPLFSSDWRPERIYVKRICTSSGVAIIHNYYYSIEEKAKEDEDEDEDCD